MTAEVIYGVDFKAKKRIPEPTLSDIEAEIAVALWGFPPDATIYESSLGYVAPEKDPA